STMYSLTIDLTERDKLRFGDQLGTLALYTCELLGQFSASGSNQPKQGQPTSVSNHILVNTYSPSMSYLAQSTERIGQGATSRESQRQRYASSVMVIGY